MKKTIPSLLVAAVAASSLSACGSSTPSANEIKDALNVYSHKPGHGGADVTAIKLNGCAEPDKSSIVTCDAVSTFGLYDKGTSKEIIVGNEHDGIKLKRKDGDWVVLSVRVVLDK